jgi:hypothetical protein
MVLLLIMSAATLSAARSKSDRKDMARAAQHNRIGRPGLALDDGEFLIDTAINAIPAFGTQQRPAIGSSGTNSLVVWEDFGGPGQRVCGARVSPAGVVLDPSGIMIATAATNPYPAVRSDGTDFLVVWQDFRSDSGRVFGARVSSQGAVLDSPGIAISTASWSPDLAYDGVNFLVVWEDYRSGDSADIYCARVTPAGAVLDPSGIAVSVAAGWQESPAVAFDGTNFIVVWQDHRSGSSDIYFARVTTAGVVIDPSGIPISPAGDNPAVAFDGASSLVVWGGSARGICGARVSPGGVVLDPNGFPISGGAYPAVAADGVNCLVTWQDFRGSSDDVYGARVSRSGTVLDSGGIAVSTAADYQDLPAVAQGGSDFLVVWMDGRTRNSTQSDIYGARVTSDGMVLEPSGIPVSTVANWQFAPATVHDGTNFLVVWEDLRDGTSSDIYGARVTSSGVVLDRSSLAVSTAANHQYSPAVGCGSANSLVVWTDERSSQYEYDVYGARVTSAGEVLDPIGIAISTATNSQYVSAVAFDGANFFVVWQDYRSGDTSDIYGARVTSAGTVLDPSGIALSTAADYQGGPAVTFDGTNFLVVWQDYRSGSSDIYGTRVTRQGVVLEPGGIPISTAAGDQVGPALVHGGAISLVAWTDGRSGSRDIYAARVTPAGAVLDPLGIVVSAAPNSQEWPTVEHDGSDFLVVWQDGRNGAQLDIYGAWVTPNGTMLDSGPVLRQQWSQSSPALARGPGNQMFLVYEGRAGTVGGRTCNAERIWGKFGPFPGVQEAQDAKEPTTTAFPSIVRGTLFLPDARGGRRQVAGAMLDISGRKVLDLQAGANDINRLSPGVYFVRTGAVGHGRCVSRIVVTK